MTFCHHFSPLESKLLFWMFSEERKQREDCWFDFPEILENCNFVLRYISGSVLFYSSLTSWISAFSFTELVCTSVKTFSDIFDTSGCNSVNFTKGVYSILFYLTERKQRRKSSSVMFGAQDRSFWSKAVCEAPEWEVGAAGTLAEPARTTRQWRPLPAKGHKHAHSHHRCTRRRNVSFFDNESVVSP